MSKNLLGMQFDESERIAVDWAPPTSFGLDNSKRLADAAAAVGAISMVQKVEGEEEGFSARIFTTKGT